MKVFDLQCEAGHGFEGWFGSEEDYQSQCARGLLTCPLCGSVHDRDRNAAINLKTAASSVVAACGEGSAGDRHKPVVKLPSVKQELNHGTIVHN